MEETTAFLVAVVGDLERIWPLVAFSIGLVGAVIAAAAIPVLQQDSSFEQIRDWMVKPGMASRYRHLVLFGLKAARGYYGPKPCLSWRGYNACFLVAMIYPILLWQLAWVLDGPAMIGGIAGFDEAATSTKRWLSLFAFWAYLLLVFVVFRYLDQISEFGARQISRVLPHVILNRPAAETVLRAFVTVVAVVAVGAVGAGGAVLYLTILIIIPATNAGLDHISVQFSRWLLLHMVRRRGAARQAMLMAVHVTADIVFALLCLGMLAVLLPSVLQTANRVFDLAGLPVVEWGAYLQAARDDPFGAGLLVTGMLATTLLPTILHMLAAGGALALPVLGGGWIARLAAKPRTTLLDRIGFCLLIGFTAAPSWAVLVVIAVLLWNAAEVFIGPLGSYLADLALDAGRFVGGPGAP